MPDEIAERVPGHWDDFLRVFVEEAVALGKLTAPGNPAVKAKVQSLLH